MTDNWDKLKKSVRFYNKEEFIPRRDIRNTINYLIDAGDMFKGKAAKSDEHYRAMREFQQRNSNQAYQIRDLKKKLEAIREHLQDPKRSSDSPLTIIVDTLKIILGDQGSTETPT